MTKLLLIILLGFTIHLTAIGQHDFGLKASGGLSYMPSESNSYVKNVKNYFQPSGQVGLFYNLHLANKFLFGAELLFSQVAAKTYGEVLDPGLSGSFNPYTKVNLWLNVSYLAVPVYFGYNIKNLTINVGFQTAFYLTSSRKRNAINPDGTTSPDYNFGKLNVRNCDFGTRFGLIYSFSKRFAVETTYYHGLISIWKNSNSESK